ncbi:MAG: FAD-binding oxidoreductase [Gammaproteobacteria bacterium]|nr:FAD-binding oxidoreductase [Gammaproteobacteria bacterium]
MLPRISQNAPLTQNYLDFLEALRASAFAGDISSDYASRLAVATDNSVYQVLPQAVVFPKSEADIQALFRLAGEARFAGIRFSPRGGGTGTNGQSLTEGIIVDGSRHMSRILELNLEQGWVRVQPGVVLDQLNAYLKPHGVFFAPNLSPSNRATVGGMANTDACGKGSRIYGKTSDHVLALRSVLIDGTAWESSEMDGDALSPIRDREDRIGLVHRVVDDICRGKKALIQDTFPKLSRFLTGYNLAHAVGADGKFNLNYILCGSEGTLAMVSELKLKLTPLPSHKRLFALKYASFDDALRAANVLVKHDPAAIETVDEKIVRLAKEDEIWHKVAAYLQDEPGHTIRAVNLVEFIGEDETALDAKVRALAAELDGLKTEEGEAFGYFLSGENKAIAALWELRKKGVGLLGNAKGVRRPIPFVEDTAVPPEHLAAYIREFRALLESHGLEYGMFGHVDVGCLHVRPALDMRNLDDEKKLREISDAVLDLVKRYGGVFWSEHGKGFRSEYGPEFFGEELFSDLRRIKGAFDPGNQLNPGKICTPLSCEHEHLVSIDGPKRGQFDRQIPVAVREAYETTVNCNGNGQCFNYAAESVMCPSAKLTQDRVHSPKGRAGLMREWLRLLAAEGGDPLAESRYLDGQGAANWLKDLARRAGNSWRRRKGEYDYSHEVAAAMDGCLACKACATACPIKVDVPNFRSRFLELYYGRYLRPLKDYAVGAVETSARWMARAPRFSNALLGSTLGKTLGRKLLGLVDMPMLSTRGVSSLLEEIPERQFSFTRLRALGAEDKARTVLLVQDPFTSHFEAELVEDVVRLLEKLGLRVAILPFMPNGKPLHVKGFLRRFKRTAADTAEFLNAVAGLELPMLGIDPSLVLCYRDEYAQVLGKEAVQFRVQLLQEWLAAHLDRLASLQGAAMPSVRLFCHCTEKALVASAPKDWLAVFGHFGLKAQAVETGCCGMAGTYGHEAHHVEDSKGIYALSWAAPMAEAGEFAAVTGYSCRSQVARIDGAKPRHPAQILLAALS